MRSLWLSLGLLAGCTVDAPMSFVRVKVSKASIEVPSDWHRADETRRGLVSATYTPANNDHKESIVITRTERAPAVAHEGVATAQRLLTEAEGGLRGAKGSAAVPLSTTSGLSGAFISVDFVPPGRSTTYHRAHAVFIDGTALVHVMYTAADPDPMIFGAVVASLRHEET